MYILFRNMAAMVAYWVDHLLKCERSAVQIPVGSS